MSWLDGFYYHRRHLYFNLNYMVIIMKGLTTFAAVVLLGSATAGAATEQLSFPHAAELPAEAKSIIFQAVNEADHPT